MRPVRMSFVLSERGLGAVVKDSFAVMLQRPLDDGRTLQP